jgi:Fe-S cluster assembly protein SufD
MAEEHAQATRALPSAGAERRRRAFAALSASGLPGVRDENWRYANLRPLERVRFAPAAREPGPLLDLPAPIAEFTRWTFIDGVLAAAPVASPASAAVVTGPAGETLTGAEEPERVAPDLRFALLNAAFASDAASIRVAAGATPTRIELLFVASAEASAGASYPRIRFEVAPGARLELIERHVSRSAAASFINVAVEGSLGRGAVVEHYRLQQTSAASVWLDTLTAIVGEQATYRLHCAGLGAQSARSTLHARLAGRAAELVLNTVAVADAHHVHDTYAVVAHEAPQARSEQAFRGIAGGRARVACNSKVIVQSGAAGTDSSQSLRGLLAGPEAEIDVRPQLEIYADEVRCSHGATAGKLDESMLFYLLSRGLEPEVAQRLLKWAFLEDVVSRIGVREVRRHIEASLATRQEFDILKEELL